VGGIGRSFVKEWPLSTGDDPHIADHPAGRAENSAAADASWADSDPQGAVRQQAGGKPNRRRKNRRRRRGPVYAGGARSGEQPAATHARGPESSPAAERQLSAHHQPASHKSGPRERQPAVAAPFVIRRPVGDGPFYAALDLGTNNCRLLVATPRDHGFRVVDAFSRIVRLGEGIGANGRIGEPAMERAIEALRICAAKLGERNVVRARLIATEACRAAANGPEFIERVRRETGLTLEIVSRETEARLAVAGCASLVDPSASGVVLFDIGGGSSELAWIDLAPSPDGRRRRMSDRIRRWMSLPVGVVNVSERHGGRHVTVAQFTDMVEEVAAMLADFPEGELLDQAVAAGGMHMLGTSGTVTTLAGVHLGLPRYDRRRVDGTWLSGVQVADLIAMLVAMDYDARVANPCIGRERADLVLAGCAILEAIRRRWPCERLRVADRGLREGVLVELMSEDRVWRARSRRRNSEATGA
jgi:exopolyphosphatase/guanosine-5'-triphosphate,3'-diphosphate pyrophosphatase